MLTINTRRYRPVNTSQVERWLGREAVEAAQVFVATHVQPERVGLPDGWTLKDAEAALSKAAHKPVVWADLPDDGEFGRRAALILPLLAPAIFDVLQNFFR